MLSYFKRKAVLFAALSLASPALGADLPAQKSPPPPPPVFTWTGLYVGLNGGYTWAGSRPITISTVNILDDSPQRFGPASAAGATATVSARLDGFFSGGQLGYNWQFSDRLIVGLEADVQGLGVRGGNGQNSVYPANSNGTAGTSMKLDRDLEFLGTARGRLGYAVTPTLMTYVTGGLAYGGANMSGAVSQSLRPGTLLSDTVRGDHFDILTGWTIGGGAEMALGRNLSAKLEYLYYDTRRALAHQSLAATQGRADAGDRSRRRDCGAHALQWPCHTRGPQLPLRFQHSRKVGLGGDAALRVAEFRSRRPAAFRRLEVPGDALSVGDQSQWRNDAARRDG